MHMIICSIIIMLISGCSISGNQGNGKNASSPVTVPVVVNGGVPKPVSPYFYGQNYWNWVQGWGGNILESEQQAKTMIVQLLRAGGINNDTDNWDSPDPVHHPFDDKQMDDYMNYTRNINAAPLFQIPLIFMPDNSKPTASNVFSLVKYLNETKNYGIRHFSIGNEPDNYQQQGFRSNYSVSDYCAEFNSMADAVRSACPGAVIAGPDLAWKYQDGLNDWFTPFITACGAKIDIASVHYYPLNGALPISEDDVYTNIVSFRNTIGGLKLKMLSAGMSNKYLAFTEANDAYTASDTIPVVNGPGSFQAALWIADVMGVGLEEELYNLSFWSMSQPGTFGFLNGSRPRPAFFIYRMVSTHFRCVMLAVTGGTSKISVYAGMDTNSGSTSVLIVNKTHSAANISLSFVNLPVSLNPCIINTFPVSVTVAQIEETNQYMTVTRYAENMTEPEISEPAVIN